MTTFFHLPVEIRDIVWKRVRKLHFADMVKNLEVLLNQSSHKVHQGTIHQVRDGRHMYTITVHINSGNTIFSLMRTDSYSGHGLTYSYRVRVYKHEKLQTCMIQTNNGWIECHCISTDNEYPGKPMNIEFRR